MTAELGAVVELGRRCPACNVVRALASYVGRARGRTAKNCAECRGAKGPHVTRPPPRVVSSPALSRDEADAMNAELFEVADVPRPRTRAECARPDGVRPCPFVSCTHHLYAEVTREGGLRINFPGADVEDLAETCSLDVADRGGATLEDVGRALNLTRQRVDQIEKGVLARPAVRRLLAAFAPEDGGVPGGTHMHEQPGAVGGREVRLDAGDTEVDESSAIAAPASAFFGPSRLTLDEAIAYLGDPSNNPSPENALAYTDSIWRVYERRVLERRALTRGARHGLDVGLTEEQEELLVALRELEAAGLALTFRAFGVAMGVKAKTHASVEVQAERMLRCLRELGVLAWEDGDTTLRFVETAAPAPAESTDRLVAAEELLPTARAS